MDNTLPNGQVDPRIQEYNQYGIDPKTGRARRRSLFGQLIHTAVPKFIPQNSQYNPRQTARHEAAIGAQPQAQPQVDYSQYQPYIPQQDYNQQDYSQGSFFDYSQPDMQPQMNNIQAMFGPNIKTTDDLVALRNKLNDIRSRASLGLKVDDKEFADALGTDFGTSSPDQIKAVLNARADMFNTPISKIDSYLANNAQSGSTDLFSGATDPLSMAAAAATVNMSTPQATRFAQYIKQYQLQGRTEDAKDAIRNQFIQNSNATDKTKLIGYKNILSSLERAKKIQDILKARGVPTNILNGTYQQVIQRLGETGNEDLVRLGLASMSAVDILSRTQSGAALTPSEVAFYEAMFPGIGKTAKLNEILTDASMQEIASRFDNTIGADAATLQTIGNTQYSGSSSNTPQYRTITAGDGTVLYDLGNGSYSYTPPKASGASSSPFKANTGVIGDIQNRIGRIESGHRYDAVGPVVQKGMYKGQRALGRWQVMEGNVTPWARELLGVNVTPQQFYASPDLQNKLVQAKLTQLWNKYGNANDVASAWFTGGPLAKNANRKDVTGTSATEYVRRFNQ